MKKIKLLLTRHGETLENKNNILQGQLPGTLSPLGLMQAEALAYRLEEETIDVIVSSDLTRSYKTAEIIAEHKNMSVHPTPLLREMHWGRYTGKTMEDVDWEHLPFGVESLEELKMRAAEFINFLRVKFAGQRVLVVGHGAFNRAIVCYLQNKDAHEMLKMPIMGNTELLEFEC